MTWWEAIILGLVQGLAEFLPISSSGHLVLGEYLLGITKPEGDGAQLAFEVFVHFGTTLSILTVYRQRIGRLLADGFAGLRQPALWKEALRPGRIDTPGNELDYDPPDPAEPGPAEPDPAGPGSAGPDAAGPVVALRLGALILLSMVPTALVYVFFKDWLEARFGDPRFVCGMLIVTGVLLLLTRLRQHPDGRLSPGKALLIGLGQGAAMIPGISRSGSTICTAIYLNVDRKEAADFSFLMLLPVIIGATLLQVLDLLEADAAIDWLPLALGTAVAYASGIWAIKVVIDFVQRGNLRYFAYYLFVAGTLGLLFIG